MMVCLEHLQQLLTLRQLFGTKNDNTVKQWIRNCTFFACLPSQNIEKCLASAEGASGKISGISVSSEQNSPCFCANPSLRSLKRLASLFLVLLAGERARNKRLTGPSVWRYASFWCSKGVLGQFNISQHVIDKKANFFFVRSCNSRGAFKDLKLGFAQKQGEFRSLLTEMPEIFPLAPSALARHFFMFCDGRHARKVHLRIHWFIVLSFFVPNSYLSVNNYRRCSKQTICARSLFAILIRTICTLSHEKTIKFSRRIGTTATVTSPCTSYCLKMNARSITEYTYTFSDP